MTPLYPQVIIHLTKILNFSDEKVIALARAEARLKKIPKIVLDRFETEVKTGVIRACRKYWTCK